MNPDPLAGTPYRALSELGQGGMGVVWAAADRKTGERVAVKVLHDNLTRNQEQLERFRTEAEVAALVDHPNVVRVLELRMPPAVPRPYFVMEALSGETLVDRLYRTGALPVDEAIAITMQVLEGLSAVHAAGVVHRDIKPSNLFLSKVHGQLRVKLLDFGIAKLMPQAQRAPQLTGHSFETEEGSFLGTALYASPEQARGRGVDRRTDVFAVGNVLYNLLTAKSPFGKVKETHALLRLQVTQMPDPPSKLARSPVPPELDELVMASLAKRAEDRFASAEAFAESLEHIAAKLTRPAAWLRTQHFDPQEAEAIQRQEPPRRRHTRVVRRRSHRSVLHRRSLVLVLVAIAAGCVVALSILLVARLP